MVTVIWGVFAAWSKNNWEGRLDEDCTKTRSAGWSHNIVLLQRHRESISSDPSNSECAILVWKSSFGVTERVGDEKFCRVNMPQLWPR
jgi:hypothetical protein